MTNRSDPPAPLSYTPVELHGDWEFKIITSRTAAFRKPDVLQSVIEQERQAGWKLVEKIDDRRIRLKRHVGAKAGDTSLSFDPYRTSYEGHSRIREIIFWIIMLAGAAALFLILTKSV